MKSNKTRFSLFGRTKIATAAVALLSLFAANQAAAVVITSTVDDNLDGTYTYNYTIDNSNGSFHIASWILDFDFPTSAWDFASSVVTPQGWDFAGIELPLNPTGSAIEFFALDDIGADDILIGSSLSGFSLTSALMPGDVMYSAYPWDFSSFAEGTVRGPTPSDPSQVPDTGSTTALFGMGLMGLVLLRFSSKRRENG
ncbi:VPDSG-CTERM sorting domain-containing protein [Pelagicoccus mobilis]|uniref:VPDSG-CTERM sorting domain-containing protein n=1 Tax=Pelagicoccus mobilis TaxID=415221 RepID=A0A934VRE5_9BACT|nr:VPDSG-CTERM sorting domain-containing protein [Pelagicoccus mobilis]MBK1877429.1 VPDSG-CTERM sorting domain-containing protein [Pelagicoccus mobilis]